MTDEPGTPPLSLRDRLIIGASWFFMGGMAFCLIAVIPAAITGLAEHRQFFPFIHWAALVLGIGGAIYGKYPPGV